MTLLQWPTPGLAFSPGRNQTHLHVCLGASYTIMYICFGTQYALLREKLFLIMCVLNSIPSKEPGMQQTINKWGTMPPWRWKNRRGSRDQTEERILSCFLFLVGHVFPHLPERFECLVLFHFMLPYTWFQISLCEILTSVLFAIIIWLTERLISLFSFAHQSQTSRSGRFSNKRQTDIAESLFCLLESALNLPALHVHRQIKVLTSFEMNIMF